MAVTYEPIATTTLSSASSTITFSSIPSSYTDLRLIFVPLASSSAPSPYFRINGDTGTNYSQTQIRANGATTPTSNRFTNQTQMYVDNAAMDTTTPYLYTFDFFSYSGSTFKSILMTESNDLNGSGYISRRVGLWRSTSAITSIAFGVNVTSYGIGTTATLYGILKA